jgi:hypothetical protein
MEGTLECNIEVQLLQQIASRVQENTEVAKAALEFNREDVVLAKEERHLEDFRRHQESTMVATFTSVTITFLPIQVCVTVSLKFTKSRGGELTVGGCRSFRRQAMGCFGGSAYLLLCHFWLLRFT